MKAALLLVLAVAATAAAFDICGKVSAVFDDGIMLEGFSHQIKFANIEHRRLARELDPVLRKKLVCLYLDYVEKWPLGHFEAVVYLPLEGDSYLNVNKWIVEYLYGRYVFTNLKFNIYEWKLVEKINKTHLPIVRPYERASNGGECIYGAFAPAFVMLPFAVVAALAAYVALKSKRRGNAS